MREDTSKQEPRRRKRKFSCLSRLLLIFIGLAVGLGLSELVIFAYYGLGLWLPLRQAPAYQVDDTSIRLAILGGSTSEGHPYNGAVPIPPHIKELNLIQPPEIGREFNLLTITKYFLEQHFGYSNIKVDRYARGGYSIKETMTKYWRSVTYKPDILVLYSGHNEYRRYHNQGLYNAKTDTFWCRALAPLSGLGTVDLLLRYLYLRQASKTSVPVSIKDLFGDSVIPPSELVFNKYCYQQYIEKLIKHCQQKAIFLIIIIPEKNYLHSPIQSIYYGPADKKALAERIFRKGHELARSRSSDDQVKAQKIFEQLLQFCSFANLYFELGKLHCHRRNFKLGQYYLGKAIDSGRFRSRITTEYQNILRELIREYSVPYIDMYELITKKIGRKIPDWSCFHDAVHLKLHVYEALSREIIQTLRQHKCPKLTLPEKELTITPEEWVEHFHLFPEIYRDQWPLPDGEKHN